MTALALPTIARAVPRSYCFESGADKARRLAQILLELGLIDAEPLYPSPAKLCEEALAKWAEKQTGPLHIYGGVALAVNLSGAEEWIGIQDEALPEDLDPERCILFVLTPWDEFGIYTLRSRCEAIERRHPGLAQTALHFIEMAAWRSAFSWTPATAYEQWEQWGRWNEDNEEAGLTAEQFRAAVPQWVYLPQRKLSRGKLEALAPDRVAVATLSLIDALEQCRLRADIGHFWHSYFGAVLRWSERDQVHAMADDYVNDVQQSGESTDDFSVHMVELTQDAVAAWIEGAGRMLHMLGCLDRLLVLLTEELH